MSFDASKPYNALPLLLPKAKLETPPALKACIDARAALAELKAPGCQNIDLIHLCGLA
jgi:hypothetical protein